MAPFDGWLLRRSAFFGRVGVIGAGLITAAFGVWVLAFERSAAQVRSDINAARGELQADKVDVLLAQVARWTSDPFLPARVASLKLDVLVSSPNADLQETQASLINLVEHKPAFAQAWQSLASVSLLGGGSLEAVLPYTRFSRLVGPNQGPVMMQRAVMGLENWDHLPAQDRPWLIREIVKTTNSDVEGFQVILYRDAIAKLTKSSSDEVRAALRAYGPDGEMALRRLGSG